MARFGRRHKQGIVSKGINAIGLVIGLNQGVGRAIQPAMSGNPKEAVHQFIYGETGYDMDNGNFNQQQAIASLTSKAVAILWVKGVHYLRKHMKF